MEHPTNTRAGHTHANRPKCSRSQVMSKVKRRHNKIPNLGHLKIYFYSQMRMGIF